jgi:hypothetical protein
MRHLKVALLILLLALPVMGDDKPPIDGMDPEQGGCQGCEYARWNDSVVCESEAVGPGWMDCVGGWVYQCDATGACDRYANCGRRCAIA